MERIGRIGNVRRSGLDARLVAGVVGLACILAACNSEAAGPAPEPPVTGAPSSETVEAAETTTASTSTTTTTTTTTDPPPVVNSVEPGSSEPAAETTVAPDPRPVPTNTMFDPETPSGKVEQATLANLNAFSACLSELPNCDPQTAMRFALLEYAADNVAVIEGWNADGVEIRDVESWVYVVEEVELSEDGTEAIASTCSYDGSRLVIPASDSSPEQVVDALDESERSKYRLLRVQDSWLVTIGESVETVPGRPDGYCR